MTDIRCNNCNVVFMLARGQHHPIKCGSCGTTGQMSAIAHTWSCARCKTRNGISKTSCQGCRVERHSRATVSSIEEVSGKVTTRRPKPDDNLHTIAGVPMRSRIVKSIISEGD